MNDHNPHFSEEISDEIINENVRMLHDALHTLDAQQYKLYAMGQSPLTLDMITKHPGMNSGEDAEVRVSPRLQAAVEQFGWPEEPDGRIEPPTRFNNDGEFLMALVGSEGSYPELNGFMFWLISDPIDEPINENDSPYEAYRRAPALHRLEALAPALIDPVRVLLNDLYSQNEGDFKSIARELSAPANEDLLAAAHLCYKILGRLITRGDRRLQASMMFPDTDPSLHDDVYSARIELTA